MQPHDESQNGGIRANRTVWPRIASRDLVDRLVPPTGSTTNAGTRHNQSCRKSPHRKAKSFSDNQLEVGGINSLF
jgi:hypothetical protein